MMKKYRFFSLIAVIGVIGLAASSHAENQIPIQNKSEKTIESVDQTPKKAATSPESKSRSLSKSSRETSGKNLYRITYEYDQLGRIKRIDRTVENAGPLD